MTAQQTDALLLVDDNLSRARFNVTPEQAETARARAIAIERFGLNPYASNSRRAIRAGWRTWTAFCDVRDCPAMPVAFEDLHAFVEERIDAGYRRASIEQILFVLNLASQIWGCPSPTATWEWKAYWRGACRDRLLRQQQQAAPLNIEDVLAIMEATDLDDPRSIRDTAFVTMQYDLLARAAEIVALRWESVQIGDDHDAGGVCNIEQSKTDQDGAGVSLYLTPRTARWLREWRARSNVGNPYVFHALPRSTDRSPPPAPLSVREVNRIMARVQARVANPKAWSGHSARVGAAQDMTRAGMDVAAIMQAGRWKSPSMPARYAAHELAAKAGRSRDAAIQRLMDADRQIAQVQQRGVAAS